MTAWMLQFADRHLREAGPGDVWTWLQENPEWPIKRHASAMAADDPVVLWASGKNGGVRAIGRLTAVTQGGRGAGTCRVAWTHDLLDVEHPVGREQFRSIPALADAPIVRQPFGANPFMLTDAQWSELARLLEVDGA